MEEEQRSTEFEQMEDTHGKRVYVLFGILIVLFVLFFAAKVQWQEHVAARQVRIEGINILSRDDVLKLMHLPQQVKMYNLDLTVLQKNILANAYVKSVTVKRDAPSTLRVEIEERKPSALLTIKNQEKTYYMDEEGVILPYSVTQETYDIPVISGIDFADTIQPGIRIDNNDIQTALDIIRASHAINEELSHKISEIQLNNGHDIILYSFENGIPIIFGRGDVAKKMINLNEFWQRVVNTGDAKNIRYIDLRFEDQIIISNYSTSS